MSISSLGVGSGLDLAGIVDQLVAAERAPTERRLSSKEARAQTRLSAYGALRSAVDALETSVEKLAGFDAKMKASSAASDAVSVTAEGEPAAGVYSVVVHDLASAQSLASETFADLDAALGEGTLTLTVGETVTEIELAAGTNTLADVRDAINDGDAGANAVIVRDGDAHRLLLTAAEPGLDNQMTLAVAGTVDPRLGSARLTETAAASDASFSVNGLELTASTNTLDDVIDGLTLRLKQSGTEAVELTVGQDTAGVREALGELVTRYNGLVGKIGDLGRYDAESGRSGPLLGDSTLRALESTLARVFSEPLEADGDFERLLDIGFETDVAGKVSLDADRLGEALESDRTGVEALVSGFAERFGETLAAYTDDDGRIDARTQGLEAQLESIANRREALDRRIERVEERLRAEFSALDALVAQFQSTSNYLASQLSGLGSPSA